ncbi:MAG TPA: TolC family protein [Acidobacteriaceae bacterium]|nr:TolC family protein [Acidobacteriaceae bacterium]
MKLSPTLRGGVCVFLLLCWLHVTAQTTATVSAPLTMRQAVALALRKNPTLLAAQRSLESTRAEEITAGLRQNPVFTLSGSDVTLPADNPASPYTYSGDLSRLFERGQKRRWRLDSARATTQVTESQYRDLERQTVLAVKNAFTNLLLAKAALKLADSNLTSYRKTVDLTHVRLEAGAISQTDFDRIDLQLASFESDYENAQVNLVQSSDQLQQLLGFESPRRDFAIVGTLNPPQLTLSLPDLEQKALAARPDYRAAQQSILVADANVKLADANGTTDPTLDAGYTRSGTYNSAGFYVSIPLRIFDRNQGEKQAARFTAQADRFSEIAARSLVLSDVDQAWAAYQAAQTLAQRYNTHYLQEAGTILNNLEFGYRHGSYTLLDYLNALHDDRQTSLDALNANAQVWLSLHQLSDATATEIVP